MDSKDNNVGAVSLVEMISHASAALAAVAAMVDKDKLGALGGKFSDGSLTYKDVEAHVLRVLTEVPQGEKAIEAALDKYEAGESGDAIGSRLLLLTSGSYEGMKKGCERLLEAVSGDKEDTQEGVQSTNGDIKDALEGLADDAANDGEDDATDTPEVEVDVENTTTWKEFGQMARAFSAKHGTSKMAAVMREVGIINQPAWDEADGAKKNELIAKIRL